MTLASKVGEGMSAVTRFMAFSRRVPLGSPVKGSLSILREEILETMWARATRESKRCLPRGGSGVSLVIFARLRASEFTHAEW